MTLLPDEELKKDLTLTDAVATNAGTVIGSGIFAVPALIAFDVVDPVLILGVFVAAGLLSLLGGLIYAELAAERPKSGGLYVWLSETMGRPVGFLYGWTSMIVIQTAGIAAVSIVFAESLMSFFTPYDPWLVKLVAVDLIVTLSVINYAGVKHGGTVQSLSFFAKLIGIVGLIAIIFALVPPGADALTAVGGEVARPEGGGLLIAFFVAMIPALWAYDGWAQVTMVAEEVDDPGRNLPRSIFIGIAIVIVVYLLFVLALLYVIPAAEQALIVEANPNAVIAIPAAEAAAGALGLSFVAALIMVSTFGTSNAQVMTTPRIFLAMGRDKAFLDSLAAVHPTLRTPHKAIVVTLVISVTYVVLGTFDLLINLAIFSLWFFYAAGAVALILYRRDRPEMDRPYRVPGYPWAPLAFVGIAVFMLFANYVGDIEKSLIGTALILAGLPVYWLWQRFRRGSGVRFVTEPVEPPATAPADGPPGDAGDEGVDGQGQRPGSVEE